MTLLGSDGPVEVPATPTIARSDRLRPTLGKLPPPDIPRSTQPMRPARDHVRHVPLDGHDPVFQHPLDEPDVAPQRVHDQRARGRPFLEQTAMGRPADQRRRRPLPPPVGMACCTASPASGPHALEVVSVNAGGHPHARPPHGQRPCQTPVHRPPAVRVLPHPAARVVEPQVLHGAVALSEADPRPGRV